MEGLLYCVAHTTHGNSPFCVSMHTHTLTHLYTPTNPHISLLHSNIIIPTYSHILAHPPPSRHTRAAILLHTRMHSHTTHTHTRIHSHTYTHRCYTCTPTNPHTRVHPNTSIHRCCTRTPTTPHTHLHHTLPPIATVLQKRHSATRSCMCLCACTCVRVRWRVGVWVCTCSN